MSRIGKKPIPRARRRQGERRQPRRSPSKARSASLQYTHRPGDRRQGRRRQQARSSARAARDERDSPRLPRPDPRADRTTWSIGVTKGYEKKLEIQGVGYLAADPGQDVLQLRVGFANEVHKPIPDGPDGHLPRPDAHRDQGHRQATGRPVRRRSARRPQARAVQGQRHPLRRRSQVRRKAGKTAT